MMLLYFWNFSRRFTWFLWMSLPVRNLDYIIFCSLFSHYILPFCLITDVFTSSIFLWAHEFRFQCFIYSCSILPQFVENENGSLVVKQIILFVVNHDRMQGYLSDIKVCNLHFFLRATAVVLNNDPANDSITFLRVTSELKTTLKHTKHD